MSVNAPNVVAGPVQPKTTSLNDPTYAAAPTGTEQLAPAAAPGDGAGGDEQRPPQQAPRRELASNYSLMRAPSYENIVGGMAPSPFISWMVLLGIFGLLMAAVGTGIGVATVEWWLIGGLFLLLGVTLASFISRSA